MAYANVCRVCWTSSDTFSRSPVHNLARPLRCTPSQVMRGLAEHLGLLVLQQRGAVTALESDLMTLVQEVRALELLTADYTAVSTSSAERSTAGVEDDGEKEQNKRCGGRLPPQTPLRSALETLRQGLLRGLEAVREVELLVNAVAAADPPSASSTSSSREARLRRAKGGEGWGEAPTDAETTSEVKTAIDGLAGSLMEMLGDVEHYPSPTSVLGNAAAAPSLLAAGTARVVVGSRDALRACSVAAKDMAERFAGVVPRAVLDRVAHHLLDVDRRLGSTLDGSPMMRAWLLDNSAWESQVVAMEIGDVNKESAADVSDIEQREAVTKHAAKVGECLNESVKALLLSVQTLCPRDPAGAPAASRGVEGTMTGVDVGGHSDVDEKEENEEKDSWSTDTTLFEAHASAFEQARGVKLWRCASAMQSARLALKEFSEDEAMIGGGGTVRDASAAEATAALVDLCGDLSMLAKQVVSAGKAVLVGMIALNKASGRGCLQDSTWST